MRAIYPGTFDPITNGHLEIIHRASTLFPELIIAVTTNSSKKPYFSLGERVNLIQESLKDCSNVSVIHFQGLLVHCATEHQARVIIRGIRFNDFEYEFQLAGINRRLNPQIETVFLTPTDEVALISSTLVREIATLGGDIAAFVPSVVLEAFKSKKQQKT